MFGKNCSHCVLSTIGHVAVNFKTFVVKLISECVNRIKVKLT